MPVEALTKFDPQQFFNLRPIANAGLRRLDTQVSQMAISNDVSGRLSVTTTDGDTIVLTADVGSDYRTGNFHSHVETAQGAVNVGASSAQYAFQRNFGVEVKGDLNEQELHDLGNLFQKLSGIFHGFFQGQDEEARSHTVNLAKQFSESATFSSLDLSVEVVRSVTVVAASAVTAGGAPATAAEIPQPSNGTTAPTPPSDSSERGSLTTPMKNAPLASLIKQVIDALKETEAEVHKFQAYLPEFFDKLRESLMRDLPGEPKPTADEPDRAVAQNPDQAPSTPRNGSVHLAYSSVNLATFSFSRTAAIELVS
ncbi:MAG: hypothetical protein H8K03_00995 [Nitrospira sp.]